MFLDHNELSDIINKLGKKLGVNNKQVTIDELSKKIINKNLQYITQKKEFNIEEPTLTASFFINNMSLSIRDGIIDETTEFDIDLLIKIRQINGNQYELVDYNKNVIRVPKEDVFITMKKEIPFELFLDII